MISATCYASSSFDKFSRCLHEFLISIPLYIERTDIEAGMPKGAWSGSKILKSAWMCGKASELSPQPYSNRKVRLSIGPLLFMTSETIMCYSSRNLTENYTPETDKISWNVRIGLKKLQA